ncbi:hypothetical protein [Thalassospira povalilytica]|uniref:hypothetical protein n=1 Tax=Thalassospira povalilytica TaxID=732237 RepID=UPI001D181BE5|nr:hypothetical protein [Thalassospira povalilytica]MCC4238773.1 hypothetical protein [Thalassospira povalilytica]
MTRSPNGLKDDAKKNDAKKRCPEHGVPETVLWKRCAGKNIPETTPWRQCAIRDALETMPHPALWQSRTATTAEPHHVKLRFF